jgi:hypothetical protein
MHHHAISILFDVLLIVMGLSLAPGRTVSLEQLEREQQPQDADPPLLVLTQAQEQRVDLFDKNSNRTGYAIVNPKTGRVDTYDKYSNRTGYGRLSTDGRTVDFYDQEGNRLGRGEVSNPKR